ncbi:MAG: MFS transporter [Candidatus Methanomethylophilaceae archaeon]
MEEMSKVQKRTLLIASCMASMVTPLTGTMMNLSLVSIGLTFDIGAHALAYVNTAFLLSSAVFMVPIAKVADIYGRKTLFMFGLVLFTISSLVAYFSVSFEMLLALRIVMGLATAAIAGTAMSMLTDAFGPSERGAAIGLNTASVYLGTAMGPVVGGIINDVFGWRSVFLVTIPLAIASSFMILGVKFNNEMHYGKTFDLAGTVLYSLAITLTMAGLINMPDPLSVVSMIVGLLMLFVFVKYEKRVGEPVLDVHIFSNKIFSRSCLASFMMNSANYAVSFFVAIYLQTIGALTSSEAGIVMLSQPIVQTTLTAYFGKLYDRMEDKRLLPTAGVAVSGIGILLIMVLSVDLNIPLVLAALVFFGLGNAIFNAPNTTEIMSSVSPVDRGAASAMVAVVRQTGMMVSMGIAMFAIAVIMGDIDTLGPSTYGNFVTVIRISFFISAVMCLFAMLGSWFRGAPPETRASIT